MTAASPVAELGSWRGEDVGVSAVLDALYDLRRGEQRMATRTSVVNLVVLVDSPGQADAACDALHRLGGRHPGRTIVVVRGPTGPWRKGLDADVTLHETEAEGHRVWFEEVRLWVRGPVTGHLDSLVEPLTLADLPVVVWFGGHPPEPSDPLLGSADVMIVDAKTEEPGGERALAAVVDLLRRHVVIDLSWIRLRPWRELLGGLFEPPEFRPLVAGVHHVAIRGKPGPSRLLAGWLSSRLGLPRSCIDLDDARHLSLHVDAQVGGRRASFEVARHDGERAVRARGALDGGTVHDDRLPLPDDSLAWSLAHALTHLRHDRVHAMAVQAALAFGP